MTKTDMLNQIDTLLVCARGIPTDVAVHDLITSQLEWNDISDLKDFYWDIMCEFYGEHPRDFSEDYYWEFCVKD